MRPPEYDILNISGRITVRPLTSRSTVAAIRILILGAIGAGKSSLIEALAGESNTLNIAKDQLEGATREVKAYELVNVSAYGSPIHLIDTPGFSDPKVSEMEIIQMIQKWMDEEKLEYINKVYILHPITDARIPGTKGRTFNMLKALLAPSPVAKTHHQVALVTTYWDKLHTETAQQHAEVRFSKLRDEVWSDFVERGGSITRFNNTQTSALQMMDSSWSSWGEYIRIGLQKASVYPPHVILLCKQLWQHIENTRQHRATLYNDLNSDDINEALREVIQERLRDSKEVLNRLVRQYVQFGHPPPGFEDVQLPMEILPFAGRLQQGLRLTRLRVTRLLDPTKRSSNSDSCVDVVIP